MSNTWLVTWCEAGCWEWPRSRDFLSAELGGDSGSRPQAELFSGEHQFLWVDLLDENDHARLRAAFPTSPKSPTRRCTKA